MRSKRLKITALFLCVPLLLSCISGCKAASEGKSVIPLGERIENADEIVSALRSGLRRNASSMTIRFSYGSDIFRELNDVTDDWMELALSETDDPKEGDSIRYRYGGYTLSSSYTEDDGRWYYTVTVVPEYYTYLSQEEAVDEKVAELMKDFGFTRRTPDVEKIRTAYAYLCENVSYDKVHRKNPYAHEKSTAYAALVLHTATCQGYAAALYRLLREAGISCRIVTGSAQGEEGLHAWVIAELDGEYYHLDPTWDAGEDEYRYFLFGSESAADRSLSERFTGAGFSERYPISAGDYR